ncbi:cytokine-dependent hematopoietic cell linker isoform X2 [Mustela erminea]|uniref:cytokine-dependent hematopoietic cell linker isoform X2 n=1 Tax=Mustela erminea TaxID=36723 RepID=UPI0013866BCA|nr:cytokine-dependent hematopoietic cell linker isoform X2 [Mustela erminea]
MNRQGNRRTTKEGSSDLKFQNLCLPKNRSWPRIHNATGQAVDEPLLEHERNFAVAILDGSKDHMDGDYEDPELHMVEAWPSIQILPARPIKESEYADTRYFKGMMDTPNPLDTKTSVPTERHPWCTQMGLEKVGKPVSKDSRSQHVKGDRPTKGNKTPLPPPRQISLKDLSEVLGTDRVPHYQKKPESIHLSRNQSPPDIPLATSSSPFVTRNHSVQNRDHKESMQFHPPQRCQSPAHLSPQENSLHYKNTNWRKPFSMRSDEKDVQRNDWYIGEHSRQAVEEALRKENKDGTFLVRDCSTKSRAEPYVLVVFYGNKVYNVKIRFLEKNQQFALGTGLRGDEKFNSVEDIIEHYKYFPIVLIDGKDKTGIHREQCYLTQPLPLSRCFSPW